MIFNSVTFLLFLLVVVILYWVLPRALKMWMLLIVSCVFYGFWRWEFLGIMFISASTDYFTAIAISNTPIENEKKRKFLLAITLIVNLGLLCYFKYLYFFSENINSVVFDKLGWTDKQRRLFLATLSMRSFFGNIDENSYIKVFCSLYIENPGLFEKDFEDANKKIKNVSV